LIAHLRDIEHAMARTLLSEARQARIDDNGLLVLASEVKAKGEYVAEPVCMSQ